VGSTIDGLEDQTGELRLDHAEIAAGARNRLRSPYGTLYDADWLSLPNSKSIWTVLGMMPLGSNRQRAAASRAAFWNGRMRNSLNFQKNNHPGVDVPHAPWTFRTVPSSFIVTQTWTVASTPPIRSQEGNSGFGVNCGLRL
jgi:hypothetical protein